jgi:hypothetical protein
LKQIFEGAATHSVSLHTSEGASEVLDGLHLSLALKRGLKALCQQSWATDMDRLDAIQAEGTVHLAADSWGQWAVIMDLPEALVHMQLEYGQVYVIAAAETVDEANAAIGRIRRRIPEKRAGEDSTIRVTFHCVGNRVSRPIAVPSWEQVRENYPGVTSERLCALMRKNAEPSTHLMLWHGLPGTGKTYALRALGWEWRKWCDLHYILDPEVFFGASAEYMLKTLLAESAGGKVPKGETPRWRLFVAEDTGELLAKDAKAQSGQGLSRLLNVVDGLIGQGLHTMILITTNERLSEMHEAVVRPGRCASVLEFEPFAIEAANTWLASRGRPPIDGKKPRTLAELYAGLEVQRKSIGFVRSDLGIH